MIRSSHSAKKKWNEVVFDAPLTDGGHLHAVLLYSDGGLNAGFIRKGEIVTLDLLDVRFRGPATVVAIQRSSTKGDVEAEVVRVVQFRDDDDLGKLLYGEWKPPQDFLERWGGRRRTLVMRMDFPDDQWCDIQLLRTVKWMEQNRVRVGGAVFLDLTDVGVRGWANVLEIHPCPPPEDFGEGEMVTGTFRYSHGRIGELVLESEPTPIGVTPSHLFWSEDRQDWVQVSQLRAGETIKTLNGITHVVSFTMTDRVEPVYNLEVAHDHCYRVGDQGILVHNQSAGNNPDPCCGLTIITFSLSGNAPNIAAHIQAAQASHGKGPFIHDNDKSSADKRRRQACGSVDCPRPGDPVSHNSCDEYPFASSTAGGAGASTKCVPLSEQRSQGGTIRTGKLANGQKYCVEVVP